MSKNSKGQERLATPVSISSVYDPTTEVVFHEGDCMDILTRIPDETVTLVVTSPPYNIGK